MFLLLLVAVQAKLPASLCTAPTKTASTGEVDKYCTQIPAVLNDCNALITDSSVPRDKLCEFMTHQASLECSKAQYERALVSIDAQLYQSCQGALNECGEMDCFLKKYETERTKADNSRKTAEHARKATETATQMKLVQVQRDISDVYEKAELEAMMAKVSDVLESTREEMAVRVSGLPKSLDEVSKAVPDYMKKLRGYVGEEATKENPRSVSVVEMPEPAAHPAAASLAETEATAESESATESESASKAEQVRNQIKALQMEEQQKALLRQQVEAELKASLAEEQQARDAALASQRKHHLDSLADESRYKGTYGAGLGQHKKVNRVREAKLVQAGTKVRDSSHTAPEEVGNFANALKSFGIALVRNFGRGFLGTSFMAEDR